MYSLISDVVMQRIVTCSREWTIFHWTAVVLNICSEFFVFGLSRDFIREIIILAVLLDVGNQFFLKVMFFVSVHTINCVITEQPHSLTDCPASTEWCNSRRYVCHGDLWRLEWNMVACSFGYSFHQTSSLQLLHFCLDVKKRNVSIENTTKSFHGH